MMLYQSFFGEAPESFYTVDAYLFLLEFEAVIAAYDPPIITRKVKTYGRKPVKWDL